MELCLLNEDKQIWNVLCWGLLTKLSTILLHCDLFFSWDSFSALTTMIYKNYCYKCLLPKTFKIANPFCIKLHFIKLILVICVECLDEMENWDLVFSLKFACFSLLDMPCLLSLIRKTNNNRVNIKGLNMVYFW